MSPRPVKGAVRTRDMARFTMLLEPEQLDQLRALAVLRDCAVYELVAEGCPRLWEDLPSAERQRVAEFMALKAKTPEPVNDVETLFSSN